MEIQDTRRAVLRALIKSKHDGVARQFAVQVRKPDGQINDMLSSPPRKSFGERIARGLEKAYPLPEGYFDDINHADDQIAPPEQHLLRSPESTVVYAQFNSAISEVIELMQGVDTDTQRDILGAARVAATQYRLKPQNSNKRAGP